MFISVYNLSDSGESLSKEELLRTAVPHAGPPTTLNLQPMQIRTFVATLGRTQHWDPSQQHDKILNRPYSMELDFVV